MLIPSKIKNNILRIKLLIPYHFEKVHYYNDILF